VPENDVYNLFNLFSLHFRKWIWLSDYHNVNETISTVKQNIRSML